MTANRIPASVTNLCATGPWIIPNSPKNTERVLAYYWSAIAEHFATLIETQNPDRDADFSAGVDWAADTIRSH